MAFSSPTSLRGPRRLGRVALTALVIGLGAVAVSAVPLADFAFAGNGNGNGGGNGGGKGGGNGGGNGGGQGNGGGSGGGQGKGNGNGNGQSSSHGGQGSSARSGKSDTDTESSDDSMHPSKLGKLNAFFNAAPQALANASPNSAIGKISKTLKEALSDYAASQAEPDPDNPDATPDEGPSIDDIGNIIAGATNKKVTAEQVGAVIDHLAEMNPDDEALNDFADAVDDTTLQDIADSANAAKAGETQDDSDDAGDEATGDEGSTEETTVVAN